MCIHELFGKVSCQHSGIVTRALHLASVNVLVQDESNITDLALYGNVDSKELKVGRTIAIKEPFNCVTVCRFS